MENLVRSLSAYSLLVHTPSYRECERLRKILANSESKKTLPRGSLAVQSTSMAERNLRSLLAYFDRIIAYNVHMSINSLFLNTIELKKRKEQPRQFNSINPRN